MFFLRIDKEKNEFGFVNEQMHKIIETDIEISDEDYNKFFKTQSNGTCYRLKKNSTGSKLFDFIEEYEPEQPEVKTEGVFDEIKTLEQENLQLKVAIAELSEEKDKEILNLKLALAEIVEGRI